MNELKVTLIDLSVDEVNYILTGLQELPARISNPLSKRIKEQAEAQLAPPADTQTEDTPE